ncbi:MAG: hypothetical protein ACI8PZ_001214 [Myxococcota bacterium]|jgi:hypothetical protein
MGRLGDLRINITNFRPPDLPPAEDLASPPPRPLSGDHPTYPFENLAFEGGGTKGLAYLGALEVLEERGLYPAHIRRASGTSSGSFLAAAVVLGMQTAELRTLLYETDLSAILQDASLWPVGPAYNMFSAYGFNPGKRLLSFLADIFEERTGSADITLRQLLQLTGRELCVPICNLTRMTTEYCHPKTTPDMPARLAVAMSMCLPLLMRPYRLQREIGHGAGLSEEDMYVDGGLLCNFPLHVFDGWYLSLAPHDTFLQRLRPMRDAERILQGRFSPRTDRTLGFTVFDRREQDVTRSWSHSDPPRRPDTPLARKRTWQDEEQDKMRAACLRLEEAVERFLEALARLEQDGDGSIDRVEVQGLFAEGGLSREDARLIFDTTDIHAIFDRLDSDSDGRIGFHEIQQFMDSLNVDLTSRGGVRSDDLGSVSSFISALFNCMLMHIRQLNLGHEDQWRTVAINTDYVGTSDFKLDDGDRAFLVQTGREGTMAFLDAWLERSKGIEAGY